MQFIRDILYELKKNWGVPVRYGRIIANIVDDDTGQNTVMKTVLSIRKAILLSAKLQRKFVQDIAYLDANKNFTYGGLFDENNTIFVIDSRELPSKFKLHMDDFILKDKERFYIKSAEILEHGCGWLLTCQAHTGANPFDVVPQSITSSLDFQEILSYDLS